MKCRKPAVLNEVKKARISKSDKILVIGCGIFPSTPIIIAEELNANVTGIDNNKIAVKLAQSYAIKKELTEKIQIEYGDGTTYPVEDYDVIFIVINVWPIGKILHYLIKNMKSGSKLVCRGLKDDILEIINKEKMSNKFTLDSSSEDPMLSFSKYPTTQSFLLIKK